MFFRPPLGQKEQDRPRVSLGRDAHVHVERPERRLQSEPEGPEVEIRPVKPGLEGRGPEPAPFGRGLCDDFVVLGSDPGRVFLAGSIDLSS